MIDIDYLVLADYAAVVAGKLYIQGGGWDTYTVAQSFPAVVNFAAALGVRVPWDETNRRYGFTLRLVHDDSQQELARVDGHMEAGRPPGVRLGRPQLVQMALNNPIAFPQPGEYELIVSIDGEERRRTAFSIVSAAPVQLSSP